MITKNQHPQKNHPQSQHGQGSGAPLIEMHNVSKFFGKFQALKDVNLKIHKSEVVVVCGPSGSGKSTLIRTLNGLENHEQGEIVVLGRTLNDDPKNLHEVRQNVGMVFQSFHLFPHMSVLDNVCAAPQWVKKIPRAKAEQQARELLTRVRILDQANKFPAELSGGQQQRVAIARALAMQPQILLFDEPTSALDAEMVKEVLEVIKELATSGMTMMCVTHEMGFARNVASRMIFMDAGQILEDASPQQFFESPKNERTREFLSQILYQL